MTAAAGSVKSNSIASGGLPPIAENLLGNAVRSRGRVLGRGSRIGMTLSTPARSTIEGSDNRLRSSIHQCSRGALRLGMIVQTRSKMPVARSVDHFATSCHLNHLALWDRGLQWLSPVFSARTVRSASRRWSRLEISGPWPEVSTISLPDQAVPFATLTSTSVRSS